MLKRMISIILALSVSIAILGVYPSLAQQKKAEKKEMGGEMKMVMSPEMDKVRAELKAAKAKLAKDGHYSCCNAPSCDFCAVAMNMCPCGMNVTKGEPVCGECADGWTVGHGAVPDVDPASVKRMPHDMLKMGYDMRGKMYGEMKGMEKEEKGKKKGM